MIRRYLLATAAIILTGAVAAFAMVAFAGAAVAFAAPPSPDAAVTPAVMPDPVAMRMKLKDMDTDHDGRWSKAEWLAGGRKEKGFDRMDTNHDGFLTPDELKAGMAAMREHRAGDMPLPPGDAPLPGTPQ